MSNDSYMPGEQRPDGHGRPGSGDEAVNWTDIQQWESAPLQRYAISCERKQRQMRSAADLLAANIGGLISSGQTVQAAQEALNKQLTAIELKVNHLISTAEICSAGVQGINEVRANVEDALQLANTWRMTIDSVGNVSIDRRQVKQLLKEGRDLGEIQATVERTQRRVDKAAEASTRSRQLSFTEDLVPERRDIRQWRELLCQTQGTSHASPCRRFCTGSRFLVEFFV